MLRRSQRTAQKLPIRGCKAIVGLPLHPLLEVIRRKRHNWKMRVGNSEINAKSIVQCAKDEFSERFT